MNLLKVAAIILLSVLLLWGCGQKSEEKAEETAPSAASAEGVKIAYTMVVSGMPMMGDLTFNYVITTDGKMGRMDSESVVTAGDQTRKSYLSYVTNIMDSVQIFMNTGTKTFSVVNFPNPADVPPATETEMEISVEPTGKTETHLGYECNEVELIVNLPAQREGQTQNNGLSGTMCVSSDFPGYDVYKGFLDYISDVVKNRRLQGSGYLEFLNRFGLSKENLEQLYAELGGFPLAGNVTVDWRGGTAEPLKLTSKITVTEIEAGPIDPEIFVVPEGYTEVDVRTVLRSGAGG